MQYHQKDNNNNNNQNSYRQPLQFINGNNMNNMNNMNNRNNMNDMNNMKNVNLNDISNENMDPSQKQIINNINNMKSVMNNIDDIHALNNNDNNNSNLYLRRHHNNNNNNSNCNQNNNNKYNNNNYLGVPSLKIDVPSLHPSDSCISANSFTAENNDNILLSSASSINSSIGNGYQYSHSRSFSELIPNNNNNNNNKKHNKKKKNGSTLFKKLSNLVKTRNNNECNDDEDEEREECDQEEKEGEIEIFTPSTGNTPRLIKSQTPLSNDEYNEEIIDSILGNDTFFSDYIYELFQEEKKTNSLSWYNSSSLFLDGGDKIMINKRQETIDWICSIGIKYELQRSTIYGTIYYFDKLLTLKDVNYLHLQMIGATCLLISIKWNEKEEKVPSLYRLSKACHKQYTPNSFKPMEIKILNLLSFKLKIVLPIDFVSYYIYKGCVYKNDKLDQHKNLHLHQQTNIYLEKFAIFFLDIISQNYLFWQYLPSQLAMAVIISSRRALKIEPYFNYKLINLCKYYPSQINKCFNQIWNEYSTKYPKDAKRAEKLQPHNLDKYINHNNNILNNNQINNNHRNTF